MSEELSAFVISPQPWAGFHVSKHHYAVALADRGYQVVFVDPPADLGAPGAIEIEATDVPNLTSLRYQTFFPYSLKFRARWVFDALMRRQARKLVKAAGAPDLVWDFDNAYQFRDLSVFGANTSIFHLVDDVGTPGMGKKKADHFVCLHRSFSERAGGSVRSELEIGHGLGRLHAAAARSSEPEKFSKSGAPTVGFVGNLGAGWLDWGEMARMVQGHPEAEFTFWGPLPSPENRTPDLDQLISFPNTHFAGLSSQATILESSNEIDIWLMPFKPELLPGGKPLNSHKILEYLSTGKAIVMNWLEAYDGNPLVEMAPRSGDTDLYEVFDRTVSELARVNSPALSAKRREFALERTYERHLNTILSLINLPSRGRTDAA